MPSVLWARPFTIQPEVEQEPLFHAVVGLWVWKNSLPEHVWKLDGPNKVCLRPLASQHQQPGLLAHLRGNPPLSRVVAIATSVFLLDSPVSKDLVLFKTASDHACPFITEIFALSFHKAKVALLANGLYEDLAFSSPRLHLRRQLASSIHRFFLCLVFCRPPDGLAAGWAGRQHRLNKAAWGGPGTQTVCAVLQMACLNPNPPVRVDPCPLEYWGEGKGGADQYWRV